MIETIGEKRIKRAGLFWKDTNSWQDYRVVCDVCHKEEEFIIKSWNYGGWKGDTWSNYTLSKVNFKEYEYGKYNLRTIHFCRNHKDAEIDTKVKELE